MIGSRDSVFMLSVLIVLSTSTVLSLPLPSVSSTSVLPFALSLSSTVTKFQNEVFLLICVEDSTEGIVISTGDSFFRLGFAVVGKKDCLGGISVGDESWGFVSVLSELEKSANVTNVLSLSVT